MTKTMREFLMRTTFTRGQEHTFTSLWLWLAERYHRNRLTSSDSRLRRIDRARRATAKGQRQKWKRP